MLSSDMRSPSFVMREFDLPQNEFATDQLHPRGPAFEIRLRSRASFQENCVNFSLKRPNKKGTSCALDVVPTYGKL